MFLEQQNQHISMISEDHVMQKFTEFSFTSQEYITFEYNKRKVI